MNSNIETVGNNIHECVTKETSEQSDEEMVDLDNKYQGLSVNIQSIRPLRERREEKDYNVDNLKRLLNRLSQHLKTKYVIAFEVKKIINYFVSIDKKKHPENSLNGGDSFYILHEEFVKTRLLNNKKMQSFMENIQRRKGIWIQMSPYLKDIYHRIALGEDRQNIIRKNGIYPRLRIVNPNEVNKERIYGIVMLDGRELLADKLTYEDLKDRHLQREIEVLRE